MSDPERFIDYLRHEQVGRNRVVRTPFGDRLLHYFDWTASGRALRGIEAYLRDAVLPEYANTHTEDDATGRATTLRLREAERILKDSVGAGPEYQIVHCGAGTTEAIHRLMQILGVYVPPALLPHVRRSAECARLAPVVFIGPYEHHSNVVPWREGLCTVVEVPMDGDGHVDPAALERAVADPRWAGRRRIGCFSVASNVTGMRTDVDAVSRILHRHGAYVCYDWAASAPYEAFDVRGRDGAFVDAVCFSPHKFLGGPGSSGVLIFHERIYRRELPPSFGGGGTVAYVGPQDHDFLPGIEEREKPGTPGILQAMRAALAVQVRDRVGTDAIRRIEDRLLDRVFARWTVDPRIEVLGNPDPRRRIGIVSFNVRHGASYLHPRFVTRLLSDLFGIQSRAGCSCAGPYGHRLLGIDEPTSERFRAAIRLGHEAIKPGWVRVNLHYTMTEEEVDYLLDGVDFLAEHGARFLSLYECHLDDGAWTPGDGPDPEIRFGLDDLLAEDRERGDRPLDETARRRWREEALREARSRAAALPSRTIWVSLPDELRELSYFRTARLVGPEAWGLEPPRPGTRNECTTDRIATDPAAGSTKEDER